MLFHINSLLQKKMELCILSDQKETNATDMSPPEAILTPACREKVSQ